MAGSRTPKVWLGRAVWFALVLCGLSVLGGLFVVFAYAGTLPRPEKFTELSVPESTQIYDRTGTVLLYEIRGEEKRVQLPLSEFPLHLQQAVIAAEDGNFYKHFGIDIRGIARSLIRNITTGSQWGGSTITQQLARSAFLSQDKALERKVKEAILTFDLELRYEKDELLGFYLNQIPMGSNVYGMGAASEFYFGKPAKEITLGEAGFLAAMIRAPSYYSPFNSENREDLEARADYVFGQMVRRGFATEDEVAQAREEEISLGTPGTFLKAPHFVFEVLSSLSRQFGEEYLRNTGLRVITTLDWGLQEEAERAVAAGAARNLSSGAHNASLVALDPTTGEVLALVGSKNWHGEKEPAGCVAGKDCLFDPQVNVATTLQGRQPGSSFKPFVYATAFQKGFSDDTVVLDELTSFGIWGGKEYIPQNYDGKFRGAVTLRQALAQSLNIPAIKVLLQMAGIEESLQTARDMGITTLNQPSSFYGPSLVLGAGEVRLLDIVSAYGVFANEGRRVPPLLIQRLETPSGRVLQQNSHAAIRVIQPEIAALMTSVLSDNVARAPVFGTNSRLSFPNKTVAAKTGTTDNSTNGWIIGYIPSSLAVGVWVGNNNNTPMTGLGEGLAGPIWRQVMDFAIQTGY
ncbi:MAG: transglycosylase domain-containing protein [Candidatus Yanofskybacteria bacterium]|nr:transglycosylase domain-containing protein [Candidatus Yanofskybacteria bacterium]